MALLVPEMINRKTCHVIQYVARNITQQTASKYFPKYVRPHPQDGSTLAAEVLIGLESTMYGQQLPPGP
jgi:hypothetical protein